MKKPTFRCLLSSALATSIATSSLTFATAPIALAQDSARSPAAVGSAQKGAYQLIDEGRNLLWSEAYRIDKELIEHTDTRNNRTYSFNHANSSTSSTPGNRLYTGIAGTVLGAALAGLGAFTLGVGTLGALGAAAGVGALGGGATGAAAGRGTETHRDESSAQTGITEATESHSRSYQIHKRADTWGLISFDSVGYLKAREKIAASKLAQNSCVQQGMAFLDAIVAQYKFMNADELEKFSAIVDALQAARLNESILLDQGKGSLAKLEKIDEFFDQRVSVVRLNWQAYLTSGGNCAVSAQAQAEVDRIQAQLQERLESSSIKVPGSIRLIPSISFKNAPYKSQRKLTPEAKRDLVEIQSRAAFQQVQTLKLLKELGYLEFAKKRTKLEIAADGSATAPVTELVWKKLPADLQTAIDHEAFKEAQSAGIKFVGGALAVVGTGGLLVMSLISTDKTGDSLFDNPRLHFKTFGSLYGIVAAMYAVAAGSFAYGNFKIEANAERLRTLEAKLKADAEINSRLDAEVKWTEDLLGLRANPDYQKNRASLVSHYKAEIISVVLTNILRKNAASESSLEIEVSGYGEYLEKLTWISRDDLDDAKTIINFLTERTIYLPEVDSVSYLRDRIENLLAIVTATRKETAATANAKQASDLERIEKSLAIEAEGLKYLNQ